MKKLCIELSGKILEAVEIPAHWDQQQIEHVASKLKEDHRPTWAHSAGRLLIYISGVPSKSNGMSESQLVEGMPEDWAFQLLKTASTAA